MGSEARGRHPDQIAARPGLLRRHLERGVPAGCGQPDQDPTAGHRPKRLGVEDPGHEVARLARRQRARVAGELNAVAIDREGTRQFERLRGAVLVPVGSGGDGQREDDEPEEQGHRPYFRSISARIRATSYPAAAMRDASSASSMQMPQVGAWPSV